MEFFDTLDPLLKVLWFIAIPTSLIFFVQTIMTFVGADAHDGLEADFNSDLNGGDHPFQLFTLRNLINFLLGFSWGGISFYNAIENQALLIVVATAIGAAFIGIFFLVVKQLLRLSEDNSFQLNKTLHQTCSVYLTIPARKSGKGKVQVSVNGAFHELDAITEHEKIESGKLVRVVKIESDNLIVVEKIS